MKTINDVTILFVDDEPDLLSSLRRFLRKEPYHKIFAGSGGEALKILASEPVDVIVSDLRMPEMDGLSLLNSVKTAYPQIIRLILSATRDVEQTIEAINTGEVYRFISKPLDPELFKQIIRNTVDYHLLISERHAMIDEIEKRLLKASSPKDLVGMKTAALMIPAGHLAGDFADYFVYDEQHVDILIGDVMGKGIQSALVAASIKHLFAKSLAIHDCKVTPRMTCPKFKHDINRIDKVMSHVHAANIESLLELEIFATLNFARFDLASGKVGMIDCGHPPVIYFQAKTNDCTFIKGDNFPLGMAKQQDYTVITKDLKPGDVFLFYSDGVTETQSPSGDMFGEQRLASLVQTYHNLDPEALLKTIETEAAVFSGCDKLNDDFTCIAVYTGPQKRDNVLRCAPDLKEEQIEKEKDLHQRIQSPRGTGRDKGAEDDWRAGNRIWGPFQSDRSMEKSIIERFGRTFFPE